MTTRERFRKIAHFELTDEIFISSYHQWFWWDVLVRWYSEGAPHSVVYSREHLEDFFGFDRVVPMPVISNEYGLGKSFGPPYVPPWIPLFEREVIEEDNNTSTVLDEGGRKIREWKDQPERMPQWLEYPVKDKKTWNEAKKRLDPHEHTRYPAWWNDQVNGWKDRDYALGLCVGSYFGLLREMIGFEQLSIMLYDDPKLVHEMNEYMEYFWLEIIKKVTKDVELDFVLYWEDMAYRSGSLISPKMFKEFMMPHYKKVNEYLHSIGIDIILVDSDGNTEELIPLWIESGLTGQYPLEVTAGMDAVKLRKKFGKNFILIGNIDKRELAKDKLAIKDEVMKKVPYLISQGGYFPALDHFCPPDVSYENYMYYLKLLKEIGGKTNN
jgi:uroporphyrinogen decarboxylase